MAMKETNREEIERLLYESLRDEGGLIPRSVEEVERAEARFAASAVELPEKLRDSRQALEKLTTREPDDSMIEVAILALKRVLDQDGQLVPDRDMAATT